jgi:hypothetical protein
MKTTVCKVLMLALILISFHGAAYATSCPDGYYYLTVNKAGTGDGTVGGGGNYCKTDLITAHPTATADGYSTFTVWSGDCSGTASPTNVYMNAPKTCTATFTCNYDPYRIDNGTPFGYESIQAAYNAMLDDGTLDLQALSFNGNLSLNQDKEVTLRGGFSCGFATDTGFSTVSSNITIAAGTATVEYLRIK